MGIPSSPGPPPAHPLSKIRGWFWTVQSESLRRRRWSAAFSSSSLLLMEGNSAMCVCVYSAANWPWGSREGGREGGRDRPEVDYATHPRLSSPSTNVATSPLFFGGGMNDFSSPPPSVRTMRFLGHASYVPKCTVVTSGGAICSALRTQRRSRDGEKIAVD